MGTSLARAPLPGRIKAGQAGWPPPEELERRRATYFALIERAEQSLVRGDLDAALLSAHAAAQVSYHYHFGLWFDPRIAALTHGIGAAIEPALPHPVSANGAHGDREAIVQLASVLKDAGGHTEVLRQWVAALDGLGMEQYVILSELQDSTALGQAALASVRARTREVALCPAGSTGSERTRWLAERLLQLQPSKLVLHIDPADVYMVAAIEAVRPHVDVDIYLYNHSDHTFTVGMELADRVLHSRPEAVGHSIRYRGVAPDRARYMPLTVDPVTEPAIDRASLGVPEGVTLSISAAGFHKTVPDGYWNFGKMLGQLLEAEPNHHHLQVGGGLRRHRWHLTRALARYSQNVRSRVHWLGTRSDLPALFGAADFLLDSAPVTGSTIRIQAMAAGLPVIATHHASNPLMSCITLFDEDYPLIATSSNEAVRLARELIHQPALREQAGRDLAERYAAEFAPDLLRSRLEALFAGDDEPPVEEPAERDYDLQKLAGLSGPVPSAAALLRRARVWLGDPSAGPHDSILRRADQAVSALRGVGRS